MVRTSLLIVAVLTQSTVVFAAEPFELGPVQTFRGMCEPSGALALADGDVNGMLLVASDEDNVLRAYSGSGAGLTPVENGDLNGFLGLNPDNEDHKVDFEAATWLAGNSFWLGSHSRSNKGNRRDSREKLVVASAESAPGTVRVQPLGVMGGDDLLNALKAADPALDAAIALDDKKHAELAPEKGGINIEGLTAGEDGKSLLIGVRNPLAAQNRAVLLPWRNPLEVLESGAAPQFDAPYLLDLDGHGIRSIEYSAAAGAFFIVAGPAQDGESFDLYRWSGKRGDDPEPVSGFAQAIGAIAEFHPEAMIVGKTGKIIRFLSDDGDVTDAAGTPCQELRDPNKQTFRSLVITFQ